MQKIFIYIFWLVIVIAAIYPFLNEQPNEVESPTDEVTTIEPVYPTDIPNFAQYTQVVEKKKAFYAYLTPIIKQENQKIAQLREQLVSLLVQHNLNNTLSDKQLRLISSLGTQYKVKKGLEIDVLLTELIQKVDEIPIGLIMVQAANESAWGTSRFAQHGYNFFGLWCFKKGCGFVPRQRDEQAIHEVARFDSIEQAVSHYMLNLNRHYAYENLRLIRADMRAKNMPLSADIMVYGLTSYSQRGFEYVEELNNMIRVNRKYL